MWLRRAALISGRLFLALSAAYVVGVIALKSGLEMEWAAGASLVTFAVTVVAIDH